MAKSLQESPAPRLGMPPEDGSRGLPAPNMPADPGYAGAFSA